MARDDVVADCNYIGPGYGQPTPGMIDAVTMLARTEGIRCLDPTEALAVATVAWWRDKAPESLPRCRWG